MGRANLDTFTSNPPIYLRMANHALQKMTNYTWVPVNVSGVLTHCRAYITDGNTGYDLLLSRNWMRRVACIHDHGSDHVSIRTRGDRRITIWGQPAVIPRARIQRVRFEELSDADAGSDTSVLTDSSYDSDIENSGSESDDGTSGEEQDAEDALMDVVRRIDDIDFAQDMKKSGKGKGRGH